MHHFCKLFHYKHKRKLPRWRVLDIPSTTTTTTRAKHNLNALQKRASTVNSLIVLKTNRSQRNEIIAQPLKHFESGQSAPRLARPLF